MFSNNKSVSRTANQQTDCAALSWEHSMCLISIWLRFSCAFQRSKLHNSTHIMSKVLTVVRE